VKATLDRPQGYVVWPRGGEAPRVRFIANITSPDDLFVRQKWLGVADFLAGRENRSFGVPFDVHVTSDDLLLVTDPGKQCVHFIDMRKHVYREVRDLGRSGTLQQPIAVTTDKNKRIYVSDSLLGNVFMFGGQGEYLGALTRPGTLKRPAGLGYCSKSDLLYIADVTAHETRMFRLDGTEVGRLGGRGAEPGKLNFPTHLWVENSGALFVTSSMDAAINVFDGSGRFAGRFGEYGDTLGFFSRPKGVATDRAGQIYVVDAIFDNIQVFDRQGSFLYAVGQSGPGPGEMWLPAGIFIDSRNRIWTADQHNHRIAVFQILEGRTP
jgi:hypothetical protein